MTRGFPAGYGLTLLLVLFTFGGGRPAIAAAAEEPPQVWGYGVRGCVEYMETYIGNTQGDPAAVREFRLFREWFAGTVSGLSAATAMDVLKGIQLEDALQRLHALCQQHAREDVFTMAMTLVRERNTAPAPPKGRPAPPRQQPKDFGRPSPESPPDCGPGGSSIATDGC